MNNIKYKLGAAATTGALLLSSFASSAFADINVRVSGNGSKSDNEVSIRHESSTHISQSNHADIHNAISVNSKTGGNRGNDNTRGDVHIESGDSNTHVGVANFANLNYLGLKHSNGSDNYQGSSHDNNDNYSDKDSDKDYGDKEKYDKDNNRKEDKDHSDDSKNRDYEKDKKDIDKYGKGSEDDKDYGSKYASYHDKSDDKNHDNNHDYNHDSDNKDYGDKKDSDKKNDDGKDKEKEHKDQSGGYNEHSFETHLSGYQEVPGPGDKDGMGQARFKIVPINSELCVELHVSHIAPATAAHIHYGDKGNAGPIVVNLPKPDESGHVKACTNANKTTLENIKNNPSHYYVNVHNSEYPDGAIRGQLN